MYTIGELLDNMCENQIAKASFADENWYVIKELGMIRYCDKSGDSVDTVVPLTFSNLRATYEFVGVKE